MTDNAGSDKRRNKQYDAKAQNPYRYIDVPQIGCRLYMVQGENYCRNGGAQGRPRYRREKPSDSYRDETPN